MSDQLLEGMNNIASANSNLFLIPTFFKDFVFEERVKINCFYCARYDTRWTCPPRIPIIDYEKILSEYDHLAILKYEHDVTKENFDLIRNESTNAVHRVLLKLEKFLYSKNNSMAISFIGGSCKLCKTGCGKEKCNHPGMSRIPIEATGLNLVRTLREIGVEVEFPINKKFYRYGLIAW